MFLTSSDNKQHLEAGYYDSFEVSAEIPIDGKVTYYHHVHSLDSDGEFIVTDSAALTTDGLDDNYIPTTPGGCFSQAEYYVSYTTTTQVYIEPHREEITGVETDDIGRQWYFQRCPLDGHTSKGTDNYHGGWETKSSSKSYWTTDPTDHPNNVKKTRYRAGCGYTKGQVVKAVIDY